MALLYIESVEEMDLEEMQKTHEDEITLLNDIDKLAITYSIQKSEETLQTLEKKIEQYLEHVKVHFANEERLMRQYDFPHYQMHKTAHDMFLSDLEMSVTQWRAYGNIEKIINFIRKAPEWIVLHINTVDAPTASFLASNIEKN